MTSAADSGSPNIYYLALIAERQWERLAGPFDLGLEIQGS